MSLYNFSNGTRFQTILQSFAEHPERELLNAVSEEHLQKIAEEENVSFGQRSETIYTPAVVLWALVLQYISGSKSCVAAVVRVIVLMAALGREVPSANTGAYCKAREQLPLSFLRRVTKEIAIRFVDRVPKEWRWRGRRTILVDGSELKAPDTPENQEAYPQPTSQKPGLGFPSVKIVALIDLTTAAVLDVADGPNQGKETGETALLRELQDNLKENDVVVADRYYGGYFTIALLRERGVDVVVRLHAHRHMDRERSFRKKSKDHVVTWKKPPRPEWMNQETYERMPDTLTVRVVPVTVEKPGWRTKKLMVVTTLVDAEETPNEEIADLYRQRWNVEIDLRSIKSVMKMDELTCKTPEMVRKEMWAHILGYNLVRRVMAEAALAAGVLPRELSFAGAQQTLEGFRQVLEGAEPGSEAFERLVKELLRAIGAHRVGNRPERVEPRKLKGRKHKHALLTKTRAEERAELLKGSDDSSNEK